MKHLTEILHSIAGLKVDGNIDVQITGIASDSRKVEKGFLFVAVAGTHVDGHQFISSAVEKGAVAIVCNKLPVQADSSVTWIKAHEPAEVLGLAASNFWGSPSLQMKVVGVTGTNGKTTTAT